MPDAIRTTCPYCGTGCGILAQETQDGWMIKGDPDHPANHGRLCSKGMALAETIGPENRLLSPMVDGKPVSWDKALDQVADRLGTTIDTYGPDSFAFYLSGQLLTEDYYAANKLAKGFLGTANVDTNSRLCMASTVAGHRRAFGSDTVPACYEDLELADLVVLVGSNTAWCHPVLFQRLRTARSERGTKVVVIDPRITECADIADLYLPLAPGSDVALFNGLLVHLHQAGCFDEAFAAHIEGLSDALEAARADQPLAARITGLDEALLARFYDLFATTHKVVTCFSQGVNQSASGTDKVNAILNCHLATGRIGKPGCSPFSLTGQPNAMGGREVGGLANQLAAHMGFDPVSINRVGRFWNAPRMAQAEGLKAMDMFRALDQGRIKAIWIMGTNPAVSLPEADMVRRALAKCPLVIVSDCVADTDSMRFAHIALPAHGWGEKNGTVTNSERTISRQRPFLTPQGQAMPDWWAIAGIAKRLGFAQAFDWKSPAEIFREHAALSGFENDLSRDFDISTKANADYDGLAPFQWASRRMFADGRFFTPSGKGKMLPVRHKGPVQSPDSAFPLRLNTGRYRDHWHTMTRTGLSARLSAHRPEPLVELHPADAARACVKDGDLVCLSSAVGTYVGRAKLTASQRPGDVFVPMHWNDRFAAHSVSGRLIAGHTDPFSGQPESKHCPVSIAPLHTQWSGLLIGAQALEPDCDWWVRRPLDGAQALELAGTTQKQKTALIAQLDQMFGQDRLEVIDDKRGSSRFAWMRDGHLMAALFLSPEQPDIVSEWIAGLIGGDLSGPGDRAGILAGQAPKGQTAKGRMVCACFQVGLSAIETAIRQQALTSVEAIGAALKAGTGCGSCVPELKAILAATAPAQAIPAQ